MTIDDNNTFYVGIYGSLTHNTQELKACEIAKLRGKDVYGPYYNEAKTLYQANPTFFSDLDKSRIVQGKELAKARKEYDSLVRKGLLKKGHHV